MVIEVYLVSKEVVWPKSFSTSNILGNGFDDSVNLECISIWAFTIDLNTEHLTQVRVACYENEFELEVHSKVKMINFLPFLKPPINLHPVHLTPEHLLTISSKVCSVNLMEMSDNAIVLNDKCVNVKLRVFHSIER